MSIKGFNVNGVVEKYDYTALDNLPESALFKCTYGTTTATQIAQALSDGKVCYCIYNDATYYLTDQENSTYTFTCIDSSGVSIKSISVSGSAWTSQTADTVQDGSVSQQKLDGNLNTEIAMISKLDYKKCFMSDFDTSGQESVSAFIQRKITDGYRVFVFPKGFVLNETLTICNIRSNGIGVGVILEGATTGEDDGKEPDIILNTGSIGIKLLETHSVTLRNLSITNIGAQNPSSVGILAGRDDSIGGSSHGTTLEDTSIKMSSMGQTVNGGYGSIAIYSNTSEVFTFSDISCEADLPILLTQYDLLNLNTETSYTGSNKDYHFVGKCELVSISNSTTSRALLVDGAQCVFGSLYCYCFGDNSRGVEILHPFTGSSLSIDGENCKTGLYFDSISADNIFCGAFTGIRTFITVTSNGLLNSCETNVHTSYEIGLSEKKYLELESRGTIKNSRFVLAPDNTTEILSISGIFLGNTVSAHVKPTIVAGTGNTQFGNTYFTPRGVFQDNNRISTNYGMPNNNSLFAPFALGDVFFNRAYQAGGALGYYYNGSAFVAFGQTGIRTVTDPTTAAPRTTAEIIKDTSNNLWMAYGTNTGEFKQISN